MNAGLVEGAGPGELLGRVGGLEVDSPTCCSGGGLGVLSEEGVAQLD